MATAVHGDYYGEQLSSLSHDSLRKLALLLRANITDYQASRVLPKEVLAAHKATIENHDFFPKDLARRRGDTLKRVVSFTPATTEKFAPLCSYHRGLDSFLIGNIFALLRHTVTELTQGVRSFCRYVNRMEGMREEWKDVLGHTERVVGISTLWDGIRNIRTWGRGIGLDAGFHFKEVESGCPACVLSVVGGRPELLVALRATLEARSKRSTPRLNRLVKAWMETYVWEIRDRMEGDWKKLEGRLRVVRGLQVERLRQGKEREREGELEATPGPGPATRGAAASYYEAAYPEMSGGLGARPTSANPASGTGSTNRAVPKPTVGGLDGAGDDEDEIDISPVSTPGGDGDSENPFAGRPISPVTPPPVDEVEEVDAEGNFVPARRRWDYLFEEADRAAHFRRVTVESVYEDDPGPTAGQQRSARRLSRPAPGEYAGLVQIPSSWERDESRRSVRSLKSNGTHWTDFLA